MSRKHYLKELQEGVKIIRNSKKEPEGTEWQEFTDYQNLKEKAAEIQGMTK